MYIIMHFMFPSNFELQFQIVVVPDSTVARNVPAVDGLLQYRKDKQELYIRSNKTWNVLATENKVN